MCVYNYGIIFLTIFFMPVSKIIFKKFWNSCNLMNLVWCICSTLSTIGLFDFYVPNKKTFLYIFIFLLIYSCMSCLTASLIVKFKQKEVVFNIPVDIYVNNRLVIFVFAVMCFLLVPMVMRAVQIHLLEGTKVLHNSYLLGANGYLGFYGYYFYAFIVRPFVSAISIIVAICVTQNKKESAGLLRVSIAGIILHFIISGGRKEVFNLMVFFMIAFLMNRTNRKEIWLSNKILYIKKKSVVLKSFIIIVPILVMFLIFSTTQRLHFGLGIAGTFWQYAIGPMTYLDYIVNYPWKFGIEVGKYLYGRACYGFVTGPFFFVMSVVFGWDYQGADYLMGIYDAKYYMISPEARLNATSTILYTFFKDYGIAGIVVGTAQFAILCSLVWYLAEYNRNNFMWRCIELYMMFTIVFSVWRYTLVYSDGYMTVVWLFLMFVFGFAGNKIHIVKGDYKN